jgi:hypothetical protein
VIFSKPEIAAALAYLVEHIDDSRIVEYLGADFLTSECDVISIITALSPPPQRAFDSGIGGGAGITDWLIQDVISYLQSTPDGIVLFEDFNSSPSGLYLNTHKHPPFWHYKGRLFWPVLPDRISYEDVEEPKSWAASRRELIFFTTLPRNLLPGYETHELSIEVFGSMASSVKKIVTDIYDGEGFLEWRRRA